MAIAPELQEMLEQMQRFLTPSLIDRAKYLLAYAFHDGITKKDAQKIWAGIKNYQTETFTNEAMVLHTMFPNEKFE